MQQKNRVNHIKKLMWKNCIIIIKIKLIMMRMRICQAFQIFSKALKVNFVDPIMFKTLQFFCRYNFFMDGIQIKLKIILVKSLAMDSMKIIFKLDFTNRLRSLTIPINKPN